MQDPGQGNGSIGRQLYLSRVEYTGHDDEGGDYVVHLKRATQLGEPRRQDVSVDLSGGFKQVTADLLRRIEVEHDGAVVRAYELAYQPIEATPFGKSLLASIRQLGTNNATFEGNVHSFDYYDDVREGGEYAGFDAPESWDAGNDGIIREELAIHSRNGTSALGMAATRSKGVHPFGGISYRPSKAGVVGNTIADSFELSEEVVLFTDVDGDGLPDKVFRRGTLADTAVDLTQILVPGLGSGNVYPGDIYFRRNLGAERAAFGAPEPLWENGTLASENTRSYAVSLEWYPDIPPIFSFSLSTYLTYSLGLAETYLADVNADGLVDVVTPAGVLFNRRVEGKPRFLAGSSGTPAPLVAGASPRDTVYIEERLADVADVVLDPTDALITAIFDTIPSFVNAVRDWLIDWMPGWAKKAMRWLGGDWLNDILDRLVRWFLDKLGANRFREAVLNIAEPQRTDATARGTVDVLRRWRAPYDGTVMISGDVALRAPQTQNGADGVRVAIQHNGVELWSEVIGPTDTTLHSPAGVNGVAVLAGDSIYFRVGTIQNGVGDEVTWDPVVEYLDPAYEGVRDANNLAAERYSASSDFVLAGLPSEVTVHLSGTVHIEGDVFKSRATTDDITPRVIHTDSAGTETSIDLGTLAAAQTGSIVVALDLSVAKGDSLRFHVAVDSPIDATVVSWVPRMYYTSFDEQGINPFDSQGIPLVDIYPEYDLDTYPLNDSPAPARSWRVPAASETSCANMPLGPCGNSEDDDGDGRADCADDYCQPLQAPITSVTIVPDATTTDVSDDIVFTVKSSGRLVKKTTLALEEGRHPAVSLDLPVAAGDELFFEFTSRNPALTSLNHDVSVTFLVRDEVEWCTTDADCSAGATCDTVGPCDRAGAPASCDGDNACPAPCACSEGECQLRRCSLVPVTVSAPSTFFRVGEPEVWPRSYRGWSVVGYDGAGSRGATPVDEALIAAESMNPFGGALLHPLVPVPAEGRWQGPNELVWASGSGASTARVDNAAYDPYLEGAAMTDVIARRSRSLQLSSSASASMSIKAIIAELTNLQLPINVGVGANTSGAKGNTWSKLDYLDLNGDRYPDVAGDGGAQYTWASGGLESRTRTFNERVRQTGFESYGVGGGLSSGAANPPSVHGNASAKIHSPPTGPAHGTKAGTQKGALGVDANGSLTEASSETKFDWVDINGDGLPDRVSVANGSLHVRLNNGYGVEPSEPWGIADPGSGHSSHKMAGVSLGYGADDYSVGAGTSVTWTTGFTDAALTDINGDGLVDAVWGGGGELVVAFNTGAGFAAAVPWTGALKDDGRAVVAKNESTQASVGAYFSKSFGPLCVFSCFLVINGGLDRGTGVSRQLYMLRDIDGDGLLDHLRSTSEDEITAARNRTGRTNLLKRVVRPYGSEILVAYERTKSSYELPQRRWVLSGVVVSDGLAGDHLPLPQLPSDTGADVQASRFAYADGYYDRRERAFFGFGSVVEDQLDTVGVAPDAAFAAIGNADVLKPYRRLMRTYANRDFYRKGLVLTEQTGRPAATGLDPFTKTVNTYEPRDVHGAASADLTSTTATIFPALRRIDQIRYEGSPSPFVTTSQVLDYDSYGNVTTFNDYGDAGPTDDLLATITYTGTSGRHPACVARHLVGLADSVRVRDGAGHPLRKRRGVYDCANGEMLELVQAGGASPTSTNTFTYDGYGNLETVTGPANLHGRRQALQLTYDDRTHTYVERVDDLSFHTYSEAAYDPRFGEMTSTTDMNGNTYTRALDEFGRLHTVTAPYELDSGAPYTVRFTYTPEASPPRAVTEHFDATRGAGDPIVTVTFTDGLGRVVQTKRDATLHTGPSTPPIDAMVVSGRVVFDHLGRVTAIWYPTTDSAANAMHLSPSYGAGEPPTRTAYDLLDRLVLTTFPDGTTLATAHTIAASNTGPERLVATTTDPEGKVRRVFRDMREQVTALEERLNGAALTTRYAYDAMGQLVGVWDAKQNRTLLGYDLLGRRLFIENPDTGRVEQAYDGAGNTIRRVTPALRAAGLGIEFDYDFSRLVAIRYPQYPENDVRYHYGDAELRGKGGNRVGRVERIEDASGTVQRTYGKLGEVTAEARTVSRDAAVHAGTYVTRYAHDSFGRLRALSYPDGEHLQYSYDAGGQASSVKGRIGYVTRLEYDRFGQRAFMLLGNGVTTSYTYDPLMQRLARLKSVPPDTAAFQDLSYSYYPSGNVESLTNNVPAPQVGFGGHLAQRFTYDDLYRLTNATGQFTGRLGNETYELVMDYDEIHNIERKIQTHSVQHGGAAARPVRSSSYDWTYAYAGPRPHAPTTVGDRALSWDANGNLTGWTSAQSAQRREIAWDEENRVRSVSDNGRTTRFVYDASGERVVKDGPRGESVYVNSYFATQNGGQATKHVFVGATRVSSVVEPGTRDMLYLSDQFPGQGIYHWSSVAAENAQSLYKNKHLMSVALGVPERFVYYYHPDHLGSTSYVTDESGRVYEHLEYFPFGEVWVEEASNAHRARYLFTSKELDEETGLYYFGARYYDPRISVWVSPDPQFLQDPKTALKRAAELSLYAYAINNPVTFIDRNGNQAVLPAPPPALAPTVVEVSWYAPFLPVLAGVAVFLYPRSTGSGDQPSDEEIQRRLRDAQEQTRTAYKALDAGTDQIMPPEMKGEDAITRGIQGRVEAPPINEQKQAGHVPGTPQYENRIAQGKLTSAFFNAEQGEAVTRQAWDEGVPLNSDATVRLFDFGQPIGTGPGGGGFQTQVRVSIDSGGKIHGTPWGPVYEGALPQ